MHKKHVKHVRLWQWKTPSHSSVSTYLNCFKHHSVLTKVGWIRKGLRHTSKCRLTWTQTQTIGQNILTISRRESGGNPVEAIVCGRKAIGIIYMQEICALTQPTPPRLTKPPFEVDWRQNPTRAWSKQCGVVNTQRALKDYSKVGIIQKKRHLGFWPKKALKHTTWLSLCLLF